jgi:type IV pilus assembly protein PilC
LTRAGVPILMALEIVREITGNSIISDAINQSRDDVTQGIPLSLALASKKVFPEMAIGMLAIGEETGELDAMLAKVFRKIIQYNRTHDNILLVFYE